MILTISSIGCGPRSDSSVDKNFKLQEKPIAHNTAQKTDARSMYSYFKDVHKSNRLKNFTFYQETIRFDSIGNIRDTATWYEAVQYPNNFRIDFGNSEKGNINLWRRDSVYVVRKHKYVKSGLDRPASLLTKGGYHYYSMEETLERLDSMNIDHRIFHFELYNSQPVYVLGAIKRDLTKPQVWYHADNHHVIRRFDQINKGRLLEVRYSNFKQYDGHWIEGRVDILIDDQMVQTERYYNIDTTTPLSPSVFDPKKLFTSYWYKP